MTKNLPDNIKLELVFDLIQAFKIVKTPVEVADFLEDLLTPTEIRNLSVRLRIAKLLLSGESQREVTTSLQTSLATTNKINNWLQKSGKGFKEVIKKLPIKVDKPTKTIRGPIEYHLPEVVVGSTQLIVSSLQEKNPKRLIKNILRK